MKLERLDKAISNRSSLTRSQATDALKKGRVKLNGEIIKDGSVKINMEADEISLDGEIISSDQFVYYILNKPAGVISATEDNLHKTVCDLVPKDIPVFPVGRLDIDTEGLLLLTNDGELAHKLLSPKKHVEKTYYARLDKEVDEAVIKSFKEGFDYGEDKPSLPAKLIYAEELKGLTEDNTISNETEENINNSKKEVYVTIHEGKFHQIKRMFLKFGITVLYLKRVSMGKLILPLNLKPGEYLKIKKSDII